MPQSESKVGLPFHIRGINEAYKHYLKFCKQSSDL